MIHYDDRNGYKNILLPINRILCVIVNFVKYKTSILQPAYVSKTKKYLFIFLYFDSRQR